MLYLSQRDPRWSMVKLGKSSLTIGRFGCTTCGLSMLSDYFGDIVYPDAIAKRKENYTKDGLIIWTALKIPGMKFVTRTYSRDDKMIKDALKDPNKAVLFNVDNGAHWVVGVKKTLFGNSYTCIDPWDASKCDVLKKYKNIVGCAFFERA